MSDDILQVFMQMKKEESRFIRNIVLTPDEYLVTAYSYAELNDIETFCVNRNNVLILDTTFDARETFSRFCMDLVVNKAEIRKLPILGTDLEKSLFQGFKVIIPTMQSLLCVKHISDRDKKKLTSLKARGQK